MPKAPRFLLLLPWEQWLRGARGRKNRGQPGDHLRGSPGAPCLPRAQEAWRAGEDRAHRLSKGLFPSGSHKSPFPSWASSAGINTIKGMFSLPPGFTMCWERKNKSFIPTRRREWRQSVPSKARKLPPAFQKRRRAKVRRAGTRGHEVWSLGVVGRQRRGQWV